MAACRCPSCHRAEEGADLLRGAAEARTSPQGEAEGKASLGSVGEGFANETASYMGWGLLVPGVGGTRAGAQTLQPNGPCLY